MGSRVRAWELIADGFRATYALADGPTQGGATMTVRDAPARATTADDAAVRARLRRGGQRVPCLGCPAMIPPSKTLCASCAEDMGYARRAR